MLLTSRASPDEPNRSTPGNQLLPWGTIKRIKTRRVPRQNGYPLHWTAAVQVNKMSLTTLLTPYGPTTCCWIPWWWLSLLCKPFARICLFIITNFAIFSMFLRSLEFVINHWTTFGLICCLNLPLGRYTKPFPPITGASHLDASWGS